MYIDQSIIQKTGYNNYPNLLPKITDRTLVEETCKDDKLCKILNVKQENCSTVDFNELDLRALCPRTCNSCNLPEKGNIFRVRNHYRAPYNFRISPLDIVVNNIQILK